MLMVRLVAFIIIPIAVVGLFGIYYGRSTLHDLAYRNTVSINALKEGLMADWLEQKRLEVDGIAHSELIDSSFEFIDTPSLSGKQREDERAHGAPPTARIVSTTTSGFSHGGMWPVAGTRTSFAFGSLVMNASEPRMGVTRSLSPHTMLIGCWMVL